MGSWKQLNYRSAKSLSKIEPLINQLKQLGEKYHKTTVQVALNWLIAQGNVIPIPGAKNSRQAYENAGAMGAGYLLQKMWSNSVC